MTQDQRLDRLERIAMLFANSGRRVRSNLRRDLSEHDDKISYLADCQIKNEDRFARLVESQAILSESMANLAESQANSNRRLDALIDIIRKGRNGDPLSNN